MSIEDYCTEGAAEFVKTLFPDYFVGVCVDIGSHHSKWKNNTWIFEQMGWDTYCIEPNKYCIEELKTNRKKVFHCAIGKECRDDAKLFVYGKNKPSEGPNGMAAGTGLREVWGTADEAQIVRELTLDKFAEEQNISHIDYLSIDTEGTESEIIESTDLRKYKVKVLVIENITLEAHQNQKTYLNSIGFHWIGRFIYNDIYVGNNTWLPDRLY